jgi:hypothetical protein
MSDLQFTGVPPLSDVAIPSGLGWDTANYPLNIQLYAPAVRGRVVGYLNTDSFNPLTQSNYTTALAGLRVYVTTTGSDSTGNGTSGNPYRTIWKAVQAVNASAAPGRITITAGLYAKDFNFCIGNVSNIATQNIVYEATGGRVQVSTHDSNLTYTSDGTYTNTYGSSSLANAPARVLNRVDADRFGMMPDLLPVTSATICNNRPGTYYYDSGATKLYVNRADGAAVTQTNTMVLRQVPNYTASGATQRSAWLIGATEGDGFDLIGGATSGGAGSCVNVAYTGTSGTRQIFYAKNCSFRYAGLNGQTASNNGFSGNSLNGIYWFENCDASANINDGFNLHGNYTDTPLMLTLNCTGINNGRPSAISNNGWTGHEGVIGIDVAGVYDANAGCTAHFINTSKCFLAGTTCRNSRGDVIYGGTFQPSEFRTSDTASMWCFQTRSEPLSAQGYAYQASDSSNVYLKDVTPYVGMKSATGSATIGTY